MSFPAYIIPALIIVSLAACSDTFPPPSLQSVIQAADDGIFEGIDENTEAEIVISSKHRGPYVQVKQLNFIIANGMYKNMQANIILVQYKDTEAWQPIRLMVKKNGQWQVVSQKNKARN
ncbi:MAG TPA: hypothetical protein EYP39_02840 [Ghiorsea sp.]|nr:hypothetical protein [Ghiorsea sp.]